MPHAHVTHKMKGRVRIRVPSKRHDHQYFSHVKQKLAEIDGVQHVETNARTGSILIRHGTDLDTIRDFAEHHGLFTIAAAAEAVLALAQKLSNRFEDIDQSVIEATRGNMDLRSIMLVTLGGAAVIQALRKDVLPPAFNLVWYALVLIWPEGGPRH